MISVQIMPRDENVWNGDTISSNILIFKLCFLLHFGHDTYEGILRSSDFPFLRLSSLHHNVALSMKRCWSVMLPPHNDQYWKNYKMTLVNPVSLPPPTWNNEGNFQDHCVANTPPPAPITVNILMCFFPIWKTW